MPAFHVVRLGNAAMIWADRPLGGDVAPQLHEALDGLIAEGATPLVVDLVRVSAIDDGIVAVLAAAASQAGGRGRALELRMANGYRYAVGGPAQLRQAIARAFPTAA